MQQTTTQLPAVIFCSAIYQLVSLRMRRLPHDGEHYARTELPLYSSARFAQRTVAKSGNLEINFGPSGDGHLPSEMVQPLLGTGRWLKINGDAIYNSSGAQLRDMLPLLLSEC